MWKLFKKDFNLEDYEDLPPLVDEHNQELIDNLSAAKLRGDTETYDKIIKILDEKNK